MCILNYNSLSLIQLRRWCVPLSCSELNSAYLTARYIYNLSAIKLEKTAINTSSPLTKGQGFHYYVSRLRSLHSVNTTTKNDSETYLKLVETAESCLLILLKFLMIL